MVKHWHESIPKYITPDGLGKVTVWAGEYENLKGLPPTPNSYANNPDAEVGVYYLQLQPNAIIDFPAARFGRATNRRLYFVEGDILSINQERIPSERMIDVDASHTLQVVNTGNLPAEVLILQGKPIGEPVAQQGPFVMNTMAEIQQAFADYRRTQFGGWPWKEDAVIFPREKGRFALINGQEILPPMSNESNLEL